MISRMEGRRRENKIEFANFCDPFEDGAAGVSYEFLGKRIEEFPSCWCCSKADSVAGPWHVFYLGRIFLREREREYFPSLSILTSREVQHDSRFTPRRVVSLLGVSTVSRPFYCGSSKEEKSFRVTGTFDRSSSTTTGPAIELGIVNTNDKA
uniref:Uncharacterized protein n=1 Tax=Vespula pensylvanica TaxID=30213 RepID=A0A834UC64_VESPE|nr:hypothetical protein H0235_006025 [Vespula pensylvanica]